MIKLYVLCGLPGSGKSSLAAGRKNGEYKFYENEIIPNSKLITVISRDMIRYKVCGSDLTKENFFSHEPLVRNEYYREIRSACFKYLEIFCDATHIDVGSRRRVLNSVKDLIAAGRVEPYAIYMNTSLDECITRDQGRQGLAFVGEKEIRSMAARLIVPRVEEGFKEVYII